MLNQIGIGRTAEIFEIENNKILKLYFNTISVDNIRNEYDINKKISHYLSTPLCYELIQKDGRYGIIFDKIIGISMMKYMTENPMSSMEQAKKLAVLHSSVHNIHNVGLSQNIDQLYQRINAINIISSSDKNKIFHYIKRLPKGDSLCHGDFHPENVLFSNRGDFIIDWMTATQGNQCSDVAHTSLLLRYGVSPEEKHGIKKIITNIVRYRFADSYIESYIENSNVSKKDITAWKLPHMISMLNDIMSNSLKKKFLGEINYLVKKI